MYLPERKMNAKDIKPYKGFSDHRAFKDQAAGGHKPVCASYL